MNLCPGIKRDGSRCTVSVDPPKTYCWWHDPANADERSRAASRGGRRGGRGRPHMELAALKERLLTLADDVEHGRVDRGDAAVIGQLLNTYIRAIGMELAARDQLELVGRMEQLEDTIAANREAKRWHG